MATVTGLVLAAGAGSRMGSTKQLAMLGGRPMLSRVVSEAERASGLDQVVVVLGANAAQIRDGVDLGGAQVMVADDWAAGMGSVLARAVRALDGSARAVVVLLGDQPLVTAEVIDALVAAWHAGKGPVVTASYQGREGNPRLFDRSLFAALGALRGDAGARELLAAHREWVHRVEVGALGADDDVDVAADLSRAEARLRAGG